MSQEDARFERLEAEQLARVNGGAGVIAKLLKRWSPSETAGGPRSSITSEPLPSYSTRAEAEAARQGYWAEWGRLVENWSSSDSHYEKFMRNKRLHGNAQLHAWTLKD